MINKLKTALAALGRDDSGATAIEYGLMAGLISVGLLLLVNTVTACTGACVRASGNTVG